jgi:peptide deformylase
MKLVSLEETKKHKCQEATLPIPKEIVDGLFKIMFDNGGIGLAAPQAGYFQRIFVGKLGKNQFCCANPKLYVLSRRRQFREEGCLTLPGQRRWVSRFESIRLRGFDETGTPFDWFCKGLLAQVVQHEMDHLNGKCIADIEEESNVQKQAH